MRFFLYLLACVVSVGTVPAQVTRTVASAVAEVRGTGQSAELWRQVEVVRTSHGVPHIRAENLRAAGYALAWLQCEDYGTVTPMEVLEASGRSATVLGYRGVESDMAVMRLRERSLKGYEQLSRETRDVYEGFAAGVNRYVELHPEEFPKWMPSDFSGRDVAAMDIVPPSLRKMRAFVARMNPPPPQGAPVVPTPTPTPAPRPTPLAEGETSPDDGSNAWAFAPSRTKSGDPLAKSAPAMDRGLLRGAYDGAAHRRFLRRLSHRRAVCGDRRI